MKSTIKFILLVLILVAASFLGGRFSKRCPEVDPAIIEALTADIARRDSLLLEASDLAVKYKSIADSLSKLPKQDVEDVLPRVPVGRNSAELDSIMSILLRPW